MLKKMEAYFIVEGGADLPEEDDGSRRIQSSRMLPHHHEDHEDLEAVARSIQERYRRRLTDYDEEMTDVEQQALLPSVRDPKLWIVKCAIGREREAAVCLMQKYMDKGDNWEDSNTGSRGASPQYQPGSPPSLPYEASTPGAGWASTPDGNYSEAGTPRDCSTYMPMLQAHIYHQRLVGSL